MANAQRDIAIDAANTVALQVYGDLELRRGEAPSLHVEGDADLVERVHVRTVGDTLELSLGRDWREWLASGLKMLGNRPLRYVLTLPDVQRVEVNGRGRLTMTDWRAKRFALRVNGLADASLTGLDLEELEVEVSGRGEIDLAGRAGRQRLRISGSARVGALELASESAQVRISGHGDVKATVRTELDVELTGYGHVEYAGDPTVRQTVSGGGGVRRWQEPD